MTRPLLFSIFFFFNDTATTEIYTLSLHDALPIFFPLKRHGLYAYVACYPRVGRWSNGQRPSQAIPDRKSTRLNSSHSQISYAVFCLKKKKKTNMILYRCNSQSLLIVLALIHL